MPKYVEPLTTTQRRAFGRQLMDARLGSGLTRSELAEKLGVGLGSVEHWENGRNGPSLGIYIKICRVLDLDVPLMHGIKNEPEPA